MIVRELITRLGFTTDAKGADQYDRRLRKLREDAEKSAKKITAEETARIARMARAETAVARLRGTQFKALQDTERREQQLEQLRTRGRERAERHQRSMDRMRRAEERQQQRSVASIAAARQREADAQRRRETALAGLQQAQANRQLRAVQVRAHAERRLDLQVRNAAQRQAMAATRAAAFDQRQAHMRRAELLREQNIRLRNMQIARQTRSTGSGSGGFGGTLAAGGAGVGGGFALAGLGRRVDEMTTFTTRLNSQSDVNTSATRDAELQRIAMLSGLTAANTGMSAFKVMRSAPSLGIEGMTERRALGVTEAIGLGAALSGSSTEATNAALIQLFQGLESNRLGGEELRSVMEQTPELARAIATGAGYNDLGEFRTAAHAGAVTGKAVIEALEKQLPELRARAGEIPITFSRTFAQLSTMLNFYLLDAQKAADITGKFNKVILSLATTIERKSREIVANMGGWEIAVEKVVAVIGGTLIPVLMRLGLTVLTYMGPLMLLAAPLTLILSSLLEFARQYPDEWAVAIAKIKTALGNLVDSVLFAMGLRLKPYGEATSQRIASVSVVDKGNGVVGYNGKDYRHGSRELLDAVKADRPDIAEQLAAGGRMRAMQGGKLVSEVQQLPGGRVTGGSAWVDILTGLAEAAQASADWFVEMKPVFTDIRDNIRELVGLVRKIPGLGPVQRVGHAMDITTGVMKLAGGDIGGGLSDVGSGVWNLGPGGLFRTSEEYAASLAKDEQDRQQYANRLSSPYGAGYGSRTDVKIDKIEVQVKEAATREAFIKATGGATLEGIREAISRQSAPVGMLPIEDTGRPVE